MKVFFQFLALFVFVFEIQKAQAQMVFVPMGEQTPTHLIQMSLKKSILENQATFFSNVTDQYLPTHLQGSLDYYKAQSQVTCLDSKSTDYAISLTIKGDYQGCFEYAANCLAQNKERTSIPLIIQGTRCASLNYQYAKSYALFRAGLISNQFETDLGLTSAFLIEFASLALNTNYAGEVDEILDLHPGWSAVEKKLAKGVVEFLGAGLPTTVTKQQVFSFVDQQIQSATIGFYEKLLRNIRIGNYLKDYQYQKAYDYLVQDAIQLTNPLDWWRSGFNTLYAVADGIDFSLPKKLYLTYLPFTHDKLNTLPTERNVHNYTQISADICKETMLQEPAQTKFGQKLDLWRSGKLGLADLIDWIQAQPPEFLNKSDVMSTLGSLLSIQGQYQPARAAYWKSHQLCAFNNRSHWGIVLLERRQKFLTFPEFVTNERFVEDTLKTVKFPAELEKYIPNYNSFPEISQHRIQFAARIWAPYINSMFESGYLSYIKLPFERLSQVPNLSDLKDSRIGPPDMPNYLYDNRLWDDVRGAGGETVAADHDEIFQTVHGDYNLLAHEMTHQFHQFLQKKKPLLDACINALYQKALKRDLFADGYSKSAVAEYFAQGIGYYLIPADFPVRYGTNVSWFQKNDSELYQFMVSIDQARGDLEQIKCPVGLE